MSLTPLFEGRIDDYIAENSDVANALWYFIHIPKTAGSSFRQELATRLKPEANIVVDRTASDLPHRERLVAAVKGFLADPQYKNARFASGHVPHVVARPIFTQRKPLRLVTMLRDPVERVISDFRYQRTEVHSGREESLRRFPTFESYIREVGTQNKMYKFLRESPQQDVAGTIAWLEQNFAFVGVTEDYNWSLSLLFRLLAIKEKPSVYTRKTVDNADNQIEDLEKLRPLIMESNKLDMQIYRHFRQRLNGAKRAMRGASPAPKVAG